MGTKNPKNIDQALVGRVLGSTYRIVRQLGRGSMAHVYEAAHTRIDRRFAVKVLRLAAINNHNVQARFEREARIGSRLGHAHIVEVFDFNHTEEGWPYIVMELLSGEDLEHLLRRETLLATHRAVTVTRQVASALVAAHAQGVIHRDLKPSNIFLCPDPKVLDFGIAKVLEAEMSLTRESALCGTPWYMAPEQADPEGGKVDQRSDVFALGLILYHMLAGRRPFPGTNIPAVLYQVVHVTPPPLATIRPDLPPRLHEIVAKMIRKAPAERYQSAAELVEDFDRSLGDLLRLSSAGTDLAGEAKRPTSAGVPAVDAGATRENAPTPSSLPQLDPSTVDSADGPGRSPDEVSDRYRRPTPKSLLTRRPAGEPATAEESLDVESSIETLAGSFGDRSCPACGGPIAAGSRFCGQCGASSEPGQKVVCPACGTPCAASERFCSSCGATLAKIKPAEAAAAPDPFAPIDCPSCGTPIALDAETCSLCGAANPVNVKELEALTAHLPAKSAAVVHAVQAEEDEPEIFVLFASVGGLARLKQHKDIERVMTKAFGLLTETTRRNGGTANRLPDDSLVGVFGESTAAVRAGLSMIEALTTFSRTLPSRLFLRVGVHGARSAGAGPVADATLKVARRLEVAADADKILVSQEVFDGSRGQFEFKPASALQLDDGSRIRAYEAVSLRARAQPQQLDVRFVGRETERRVIEEAAKKAAAGAGQALLVVGEKGTGKTALLQQAAAICQRSNLDTHLVGEEHSSAPISPIAALVRTLIGAGASSTERWVQQVLEGLGDKFDATDRRALAHMAEASTEMVDAEAEAFEIACRTTLRRLLRLQLKARAAAILIDDVRLLGERERALVSSMESVCREEGLLLIASDRQESLEGWENERFLAMEIKPLKIQHAQRLISQVAGDRPVHPQLVQRLIQHSGCNPLYLKELAQWLQQRGQLVADSPRGASLDQLTLPDGMRALVLARTDGLSPDAKRALINAAVIGRSFPVGLLSRLIGDQVRQLTETLDGLCERDLLLRDADKRIARMRFRHEVVREVLYDLVDPQLRKSIHDRVATLLKAGAGGAVSPEESGFHLERAERFAEAAAQLQQAGQQRIDRRDNRTAIELFQRAIKALEQAQANSTAPDDALGTLLFLKGKVAQALNRVERWDEAERIARECHRAAMSEKLYVVAGFAAREVATSYSARGRLNDAAKILQVAYEQVKAGGAVALASDLVSDLGEVQERLGDLRQAAATLLVALETLNNAMKGTKNPPRTLYSRLAEVLNRLGRVGLLAGHTALATRHLEAARAQALKVDNVGLAARILANLGSAQAAAGDTAKALATLDEALNATREAGDRVATAKILHNMARLHLASGQRLDAKSLARESFDLCVEIGWREGEAMGSALLDELSRLPN